MEQNLAFSNPIYGQIQKSSSSSSSKSSSFPVPKPRLSKNKSKEQIKQEENLNVILNQPIMSKTNFQDTVFNDNKRSSSLCLGDIRMTQLLEEIKTLTDSLQKNFSSTPENVDEQQQPTTTTATAIECSKEFQMNEVPRRMLRRKKIPVKSNLFQISFTHEDKDKNNNAVINSDDSGVFLMASYKSKNYEDEINEMQEKMNNIEFDKKEKPAELEEPPKLPPRKPLRSDIVPKMDPIKTFEEQLSIEHLHNDTLSLQRSGYLWKTGPNYKSFKNRWCVLYWHNQNYFDANVSYYYNRASMSASLCGKILLAEIEFIVITETIPSKTRLPKIEKVNNNNDKDNNNSSNNINNNGRSPISVEITSNINDNKADNQSLCFFEIGVKSRQGRIYLFAARSHSDRQQWIQAFVQTITLHAFKNKEIYHCGFVRAKFTITAKWQTCFAILTTDRIFYVFELEQNNAIPTLECDQYHIFNLRKTVRLTRMDEMNEESTGIRVGPVFGSRKSTDSIKENCPIDCKFGFCLTQNGGHVVYLICAFESHINLWYRSIWKFWLTPRQPTEKLILSEQYLTKENVPVAVDKCLKFLDTFNQSGLNLFSSLQNSIDETVISKNLQEKFIESSKPHLGFLSQQIPHTPSFSTIPSDMDLVSQQNLLTQLRFSSWNVHLLPQKYNACQISQLLLHYLRSMNECIFTETLLTYWIKLSLMMSTKTDETVNVNLNNNNPTELINFKNEQMKRLLKLMPSVNYATLRRFIIYLSNATSKNEENFLSTSLCKTLFFSKQNKTPISVSNIRSLLVSLIQNHVLLFDITKEELEKELHIKRVANLILSQNRKENAKKQQQRRIKMICSYNNEKLLLNSNNSSKNDEQKINSLIIGIKVKIFPDSQPTTVNVHINQNTTANDIFEMILEKVKLEDNEEILNSYSVFEMLCNRRLERIIMGKEKILPLVLRWSNWPSHWSMEAAIEIKPTEQLLKGQDRKKIKLPNLNVIRFKNDSLNYAPTLLMSVIRYYGQSDTRLIKHVLVEFSSSQLFLYCKETNHLLGQYGLDDIYWYVGIESVNIFQYPPVKCSSIVEENIGDTYDIANGSNNKSGRQRIPQSNTTQQTNHSDYGIPALTFIERHRIKSRQSHERRNFGKTLLFNSWIELDQWIKGLLEASFHKELFDI